MENNNDLTFASNLTTQNHLAHEQLARDEQFVGVLFATVLLLANKEKYNITPEKFAFTEYYKDTELYAIQRDFVKKIIESPLFKDFMDYFTLVFNKSENSSSESPLNIFFNSFKKGDKAFLIRQIFRHTEQVLEKYRFVHEFTASFDENFDVDYLNRGLWTHPVEQKVLCLAYIFSKIKDNKLDEKETIAKTIEKQNKVDDDVVISSDEELYVYKFFSAFYIQFLLQKEFSNTPILKLQFMEKHLNDQIYASQRIFINNLIGNSNYKVFCDEMKNLFLEYNENKSFSPCNLFLSRINKEALLKQIFIQGSGKYKFLHPFVDLSGTSIDLDDLYNKIWHLSQEQQIVIFAYIFSRLHDTNVKKKKLLKDSFTENCQRVQYYNKQTNKGTQTEAENIEFFLKMVSLMAKK